MMCTGSCVVWLKLQWLYLYVHESIKVRAQLGYKRLKQWRSENILHLRARNILVPPPVKVTEFEVKNRWKRCGRSKSRTFYEDILFFFDSNNTHLLIEMPRTKLN